MAIGERTVDLPGAFAAEAVTAIPGFPIPGTGYRKADMDAEDIVNGFLYANVADSSVMNQLLYALSFMVRQVSQQGFLSWCETTPYEAVSFCMGADGVVYFSTVANTGIDPTVDNTGTWQVFFSGNRLNAGPTLFPSIVTEELASTGAWQTINISNAINGAPLPKYARYAIISAFFGGQDAGATRLNVRSGVGGDARVYRLASGTNNVTDTGFLIVPLKNNGDGTGSFQYNFDTAGAIGSAEIDTLGYSI